MKDKKGFTLIELLAIIVILAIIAVITVPLILGIIDESKEKASISSAYGFKDAIEKHYVKGLLDNQTTSLNGTYTITNGMINNEEIPASGTKPTNGILTYQNNKLVSGCLTIDGYKVEFQNDKFTSEKGECEAELVCGENEYIYEPTGYVANNSMVNSCNTVAKLWDFDDEQANAYCNGETINIENGDELSFETDLEWIIEDQWTLDFMTYIGMITQSGNTYVLNNTGESKACEIVLMWEIGLDNEGAYSLCNGAIVKRPYTEEDVSLENLSNEEAEFLLGMGAIIQAPSQICKPIPPSTDLSCFTYNIDNNEATITGYTCGETIKNVVLPSIIKQNQKGITVTAIGDSAFYGTGITSIEIPDSVTVAGELAVENVESIKIGGRNITPSIVMEEGHQAHGQIDSKFKELKIYDGITIYCYNGGDLSINEVY